MECLPMPSLFKQEKKSSIPRDKGPKSSGGKSELFTQNMELRSQNEQLRRKLSSGRSLDGMDSVFENPHSSKRWKPRKVFWGTVAFLLLIAITFCIVAGSVLLIRQGNSGVSSLESVAPVMSYQIQSPPGSSSQQTTSLLKKLYMNIGMVNNRGLQECQGPFLKTTFPDLDYAGLGYNVFRGYPLAIGHDPGFTYPIFTTDYSALRMTSDCRYSVPSGFIVIPDVSCVTSFSSDEIRTTAEFSKQLSSAAHVDGGGFGVSFSASAGYKEMSSEMSSASSTYVISKATCNYYFSRLDLMNPPLFKEDFLEQAASLATANPGDDDVMKFIDYYGTHFPTHITFGARYTFQHQITSSEYKKLSSKGYNVAAQAGYSGLFSVGGGFNLDSSQREAASEFSKSVKTTTITVGAPPPANGDAMTWASNVKESPVPAEYELQSLDKLFTENYMNRVRVHQHLAFNVTKVRLLLEETLTSTKYCEWLRNKGEVDCCENPVEEIMFKDTLLLDNTYQQRSTGLETCKTDCLKDKDCLAITYCDKSQDQCPKDNCRFLRNTVINQVFKKGFKSVVFLSKIKHLHREFVIKGSKVTSGNRGGHSVNDTMCEDKCLEDHGCDLYWYCDPKDCAEVTNNCELYSSDDITLKTSEFVSQVKFVQRNKDDSDDPDVKAVRPAANV